MSPNMDSRLFFSLANGLGLLSLSVSVVVVELLISSILLLISLAVAILGGSAAVLTTTLGTMYTESGI